MNGWFFYHPKNKKFNFYSFHFCDICSLNEGFNPIMNFHLVSFVSSTIDDCQRIFNLRRDVRDSFHFRFI